MISKVKAATEKALNVETRGFSNASYDIQGESGYCKSFYILKPAAIVARPYDIQRESGYFKGF
jgi:hypothetical protein